MSKALTFYLCDSLFGIDITMVKEINRNIEYTPVPESKNYIIGLFNMRGQVVTLFDLAKMMAYENASQVSRSIGIVLKTLPNSTNLIGFLIDRPGNVVDIDPNECEPPAANTGEIDGEFISDVVKLKDELLMMIDPVKIFKTNK